MARGSYTTSTGWSWNLADRVLVADRQNHRIMVFAADGKWIEGWPHDQKLSHEVNPGSDDLLYVHDGSMLAKLGCITILNLDGHVVERFAVHCLAPPISSWMHYVNFGKQENLYVADSDACHKLERLQRGSDLSRAPVACRANRR